MDLPTLVLLGIGLAMDCLAVSLAAGTSIRTGRARAALIVAVSFGGFQAGMTLAGWALGEEFYGLISDFDHWVAFLLLLIIGARMIAEAVRDGEEHAGTDILVISSLLLLSLATSIDALAVGLSLAFLQVDILPACAVIGGITFLFAFAGMLAGAHMHRTLGRGAGLAGGAILILIGARILAEHLLSG
jgi:putative Mn2+ efflux pump MntP